MEEQGNGCRFSARTITIPLNISFAGCAQGNPHRVWAPSKRLSALMGMQSVIALTTWCDLLRRCGVFFQVVSEGKVPRPSILRRSLSSHITTVL
jgi:hypothetical protein